MISHKKLAILCSKSYMHSTFKVDDVEVLIEEVDGVQIIVPRGTETEKMWSEGGWRDVIMDLRFWPSGYYGLRGHTGFLSGARKIEKELLARLDKSKPVVVSGHSLGGGIAIPVSRMLVAHRFNVNQLVTFGTPRCISKGHEQFKTINIFEYEHGDDIVPTFQFWTTRKHFNRISIGKSRSKNWFLHRTWNDHGLKFYIDAGDYNESGCRV